MMEMKKNDLGTKNIKYMRCCY